MHIAPHLLLVKDVGNVVGSEGTRAVRLQHAGFRDTTISVTISPSDTLPLTLVLTRKP